MTCGLPRVDLTFYRNSRRAGVKNDRHKATPSATRETRRGLGLILLRGWIPHDAFGLHLPMLDVAAAPLGPPTARVRSLYLFVFGFRATSHLHAFAPLSLPDHPYRRRAAALTAVLGRLSRTPKGWQEGCGWDPRRRGGWRVRPGTWGARAETGDSVPGRWVEPPSSSEPSATVAKERRRWSSWLWRLRRRYRDLGPVRH